MLPRPAGCVLLGPVRLAPLHVEEVEAEGALGDLSLSPVEVDPLDELSSWEPLHELDRGLHDCLRRKGELLFASEETGFYHRIFGPLETREDGFWGASDSAMEESDQVSRGAPPRGWRGHSWALWRGDVPRDHKITKNLSSKIFRNPGFSFAGPLQLAGSHIRPTHLISSS